MRIAVIGSRGVHSVNIGEFVAMTDEIVSGGASGVDACAEKYAKDNGIKITVFLPEYNRYGRGAPIVRNKIIVDYTDKVIAFWDGKSRGTLWVIKYAKATNKPCQVIYCE